jgi:hypothetical protein
MGGNLAISKDMGGKLDICRFFYYCSLILKFLMLMIFWLISPSCYQNRAQRIRLNTERSSGRSAVSSGSDGKRATLTKR